MVSMRLINIKTFLHREQSIDLGKPVDRRAKVLEFRDETTDYAILSHRWVDPMEVDYEEMTQLTMMAFEEQTEIRDRSGYKKIVDTCKQAKKDGYKWVWIDTCCIDKRSSAELSEAINSMYRWYENAKICYAYLHDVLGSFPRKTNDARYSKSNGWPEWFSRGWTLQEMIAPNDVQFFDKNWKFVGSKITLATTLTKITRVPEHILENGLNDNRPCVAQIMSWAANRTTTRVEDRAYSLMGLLDVNMPMLYGEGKKAFHRLQLETIRSSNDQSIFAWGQRSSSVRIGSILADDPSFFEDCSGMVLMDHDEFIEEFPELSSTSTDHLGVFTITNRGIQIWMLLYPYPDSNSIFRVFLPCWNEDGSFVTIDLVLQNFSHYRYSNVWEADLGDPQFRQVYLRYQDTPNNAVTFEIDDSGIIENGFIRSHVDPETLMGNPFTLTAANPLCIKTYFEGRDNGHFKAIFGQYFGLDWVHLDGFYHGIFPFIEDESSIALGPAWALSIVDPPSGGDSHGYLWVHHFRLPGSTWIVRTYRIAWERSRIRVRMDAFQDSHFQNGLNEWKVYDVEVSNDFSGTWITTMSIHRRLVVLVKTQGVSCCMMD